MAVKAEILHNSLNTSKLLLFDALYITKLKPRLNQREEYQSRVDDKAVIVEEFSLLPLLLLYSETIINVVSIFYVVRFVNVYMTFFVFRFY